MEFRAALPEESDLLGEMVLAGVAHWGHDVNFPDGAIAGFYEAMGASLERDIEMTPGFELGRMWYDLDQHSPGADPN